jgi:hypothetical protein
VDLAAIDWSTPWLAPYRSSGEPVTQAVAAGLPLLDALNRWTDRPPRFVDPSSLPAGEPYEAFIARTGNVPTRSNAHDLFNALVWRAHPRLKAHLNAMQVEQIERVGVGAARGAVRDALTLFDENAAWLQAPSPVIDALRQRDWTSLFVTHRRLWRDVRLVLFGHALLEKLLRPRKAITAHVWVVPMDVADPASWLVGRLIPDSLAAKPWLPLPVLGVPGWWNLNEQSGFYDDAAVFRGSAPNLKSDAPTV